jgi:CheY-like chemotaxis protein
VSRQTLELTRHKWEKLGQQRNKPIAVREALRSERRVRGSSSEIRELLTNLVFNAVDAMPEGGALTVRSWSTASDVFVAVQDSGTGIPETVRRRLFEPFFSTKGERGTGLGLSVSFGIVRRHGGEITVESEVGRGTTFTIRFPAMADEVGQAAPEAACAPAAPPPALRVLVVEDEASIRQFLDAALTGMGCRPRLEPDAESALRALEEEQFDLVLTDMGLPGATGQELAQAAAECWPGTPVVLMSGWGDQLMTEGKQIEGVWRVLSKPLPLRVLGEVLSEVGKG